MKFRMNIKIKLFDQVCTIKAVRVAKHTNKLIYHEVILISVKSLINEIFDIFKIIIKYRRISFGLNSKRKYYLYILFNYLQE